MNSTKVKTKITFPLLQARAATVGLVVERKDAQHGYRISNNKPRPDLVFLWCENLAAVDHRLRTIYGV